LSNAAGTDARASTAMDCMVVGTLLAVIAPGFSFACSTKVIDLQESALRGSSSSFSRILLFSHHSAQKFHGEPLLTELSSYGLIYFLGFTSFSAVVITNFGTLAIYSGIPQRRGRRQLNSGERSGARPLVARARWAARNLVQRASGLTSTGACHERNRNGRRTQGTVQAPDR
jgi:hypothetical protein